MASPVSLAELIKDLDLEIVYAGKNDRVTINTSDINRPGLQFANYFTYFGEETSSRLQVIGLIEMAYLNDLDTQTRGIRLKHYFSHSLPCVILCRGMEPTPEMLKEAKKYQRTLLKTDLITTEFISVAVNYLDHKLAPRMNQHGVLVDVYDAGVLLIGESGIGKSETALELVKRGHRLVSDDVVNIKKVAKHRLIGEAPESIRHFMEIRGIGIINVQAMYGVGATIDAKGIDLVVQLEAWEKNKHCERLGLDEEFIDFLGVDVHLITIPVKPGRNLAIIIEAGARDFRLKKAGYNAAAELHKNILSFNGKNPN